MDHFLMVLFLFFFVIRSSVWSLVHISRGWHRIWRYLGLERPLRNCWLDFFLTNLTLVCNDTNKILLGIEPRKTLAIFSHIKLTALLVAWYEERKNFCLHNWIINGVHLKREWNNSWQERGNLDLCGTSCKHNSLFATNPLWKG